MGTEIILTQTSFILLSAWVFLTSILAFTVAASTLTEGVFKPWEGQRSTPRK